MLKSKKFLCLVLSLVIILSMVLAGCGNGKKTSTETKLLRLSWPPAYNPMHGHTKAALAMNEVLQEKTGGSVQFEFYPGGQLGNEVDVWESIQLGAIDASIMSGTIAAGFTDALLGFDMPYLFHNDLDFYYQVVTSDIAQELFKKMEEEAGVKGIAFLVNPGRDFYFNANVTNLEDAAGLVLRSMQSEIHLDTYRALGLSPTPLAYSEIYTSMQTKAIDGFEDVSASVQANKTYETATHMLVSGHFNAAPIVIMSQKAWNSLTAKEQEAVMEAGKAAQLATLEHYKEQVPLTIQFMKDAGLTVNYIDMEQAQALVQPVIDEYANKIPSVKKVVDYVKELDAKASK